jgi:hypothetical protein
MTTGGGVNRQRIAMNMLCRTPWSAPRRRALFKGRDDFIGDLLIKVILFNCRRLAAARIFS